MQQSAPHLSLPDKDIFLKELRAITSPSHKKLEEIPLSQAIVSPGIHLQDYALYLSKMKAFVSAFEKELFPALAVVFPDLESRKKTHWLESDLSRLKTLGIDLPEIPLFYFQANLSEAWLAGAMYVLEGSTLGGKFIYKNIHIALSLDAENGAMYFNGYGADTGKQWGSFLDQFCAYATTENKNEIFKGADDTFKMLFDLLSK